MKFVIVTDTPLPYSFLTGSYGPFFVDAEADEFEDAGANLRSPYWKHFKIKKEGKKIVAYVYL